MAIHEGQALFEVSDFQQFLVGTMGPGDFEAAFPDDPVEYLEFHRELSVRQRMQHG